MPSYSLTPATLDATFVSFDLIFQRVFEDTPNYWQRIASLATSTTATTRHAWMEELPELREWIGERHIENLLGRVQEISNKTYESTVRVKRTDIEDEQLGVYGPRFEALGRATKLWPDRIVIDALKSATIATTYDGQHFFDASHPINPENPASGTQSNLFANAPLNEENLASVRSIMMTHKGRNGVSMELVPNLLVVPPQLEYTARKILFGELNSATTNVLKGVMDLLVLPRLSDEPTSWYAMVTDRAVKPIIFQERLQPEFTFMNKPDDSNVFWRDEYLFGVRTRGAAGLGPWFLAAKAMAQQ